MKSSLFILISFRSNESSVQYITSILPIAPFLPTKMSLPSTHKKTKYNEAIFIGSINQAYKAKNRFNAGISLDLDNLIRIRFDCIRHICTDDYYVFLKSDNKSPAATVISDYDWSDSLSGYFCIWQRFRNIGGARPLSVSGRRYRMLNVTTDTSSIVTKKMIMCSCAYPLEAPFKYRIEKEKPPCT